MTNPLHPGVYIEEFTPASPIQGVGTSTAAFIGVAADGPIMTPVRLTSWDEFEATFGGHVDSTFPTGDKPYLALSVRGFFQNGGTACYIVRASAALNATGDLEARNTAADPTIVVKALEQGSAANGITVTVSDRSLLDDAIGADLVAYRKSTSVTAMPSRRALTVGSSAGFAAGDVVTLEDGALPDLQAVVDEVADATTLTLVAPLPGTDDYSGGTVRIADLGPGTTTIRIAALPANQQLRRILAVGSTIEVDVGGTDPEWRIVAAVGNDSITLRTPLSAAHDMTADVTIASREFDLHVADPRTGRSENLTGLATDAAHPSWWGRVVSSLVTLEPPKDPPSNTSGDPITDPRPAAGTVTLANGADDDMASSWQGLLSDPSDALDTLSPVDEVSIVAIPGAVGQSAHQAIVGHCELMGDRVAILDPSNRQPPTSVVTEAAQAAGTDRGFAAMYYPWIRIMNAATRQPELWPPSAHMAGVYARTDSERGVHKAPANTSIRGALGLERRLTDADQDLLNPAGVSALRIPPNGGAPVVWGARTTTTVNRNWQYVNIRRLFNYLEESIADGIRWAVFEPNDISLWKKLERSIGVFLAQAWRDGALFGATREQAFYVRIDEALNPPSTRSLGRLYIEIGVQPVYPAEFVIVRIGIWDGGSESSES